MGRTVRRRRAVAGLVLLFCLGSVSALRAEYEGTYVFSQSPGDLADALEAYSRATRVDVVARGEVLAGRKAPGLQGTMTAEEALKRLLQDAGLSARRTGVSAVAVVPATEWEGTRDADDAARHEVNEVLVVDYAERGYAVESATTATRLDVPLRDVPQTVNVVPRELLEDRAMLRPAEVADVVPGVQAFTGYGGITSGDFFIRGFGTDTTYRNGFKDFSFLSPVELAGIERVEFLKGPGSVLYGGGQPGGMVNYLSKRPVPQRICELTLTGGSENLYRAALDLGGTLVEPRERDEAAPLTYRLNASIEDADSHRDYVGAESLFLAPAVTWQIGSDTSLTVLGEYHRYDYVFDRGLLAVPQALKVPESRFLGEPGNHAETNAWRAAYELKHRLGEAWEFRSGFAAIVSDQESHFAQPYAVAADDRTVLRQATARHERSENYTLQNEVSGAFHTGGLAHELLAGVELARYEFRYEMGFMAMDSIDFLSPVYGAPLSRPALAPLDGYSTDSVGLFVQDLITISPQWKMLAGLRHDSFRTRELLLGRTLEHEAWSPRVGLVYQPWEPLSLFAGWSHAFSPNFGVNRDKVALPPEKGEQLEAGVKLDLLEKKLAATLSVYEITKANVQVTDPVNPEYVTTAGEQKSRGLELDVTGALRPGWNVSVNYGYTDARVSEDPDIPAGTPLAGVPEHEGALWTTYEWQSGPLKGFGLGTGLAYAGTSPATLQEKSVILPSAWRWDAAVYYRRERWQAQVNFKNLTSERGYQSQGALIYPEPPLQVQASVVIRF